MTTPTTVLNVRVKVADDGPTVRERQMARARAARVRAREAAEATRRAAAGRPADSLPELTRRHDGSGALNPAWVEWLMGFPPGWTALEDSGTPSSPRSPSGSAGN